MSESQAPAYTFVGEPDPARLAILVERVLAFVDRQAVAVETGGPIASGRGAPDAGLMPARAVEGTT